MRGSIQIYFLLNKTRVWDVLPGKEDWQLVSDDSFGLQKQGNQIVSSRSQSLLLITIVWIIIELEDMNVSISLPGGRRGCSMQED